MEWHCSGPREGVFLTRARRRVCRGDLGSTHRTRKVFLGSFRLLWTPRKKPLQSLRVRGLCLSTFDLEPRQSLEVGALPVSGEL